MAYTANSSGSDTEVQSCSKNCVKTYEKLQKQFDEQRQTLSKANLEIVAYQLGLESVEAQLVVHQKNEVVYEEKIAVLEFEVKDKSNAITRLKNQLDETLREKDDLKAKLEQFETSSKNLNKLINSQLSSKDKTGLGYGDQLNENDSSGSELFNSVFDSRSSDGDDNQTNDRFKKDNGYHVVPPPLTGNYMPPLADLSFAGLDDSVYRPTANKTSASVSQVETSTSQTSNTSVEMPRVESVRPSGVIIEDWVSDDEDIFQSNDLQATDKPSLKRIEFTNARNESVKPKQAKKPRITTQNPKVDRRDWNEKMTQKLGLGFGFTKKACFVCGSYSHLIKDCDFHEKRMAKKSVLKNTRKNTGQRFGRVPVSATKQSSLRATTSTSTFRPVNTATYTNRVNVSKLKTNAFHKSHSPIIRSFYKSTAPNTRISNEKVNTVRVNGVNTAGQTTVSAIKGNPQQALKNKGKFDNGSSRPMTRNKDFLTDYQDIDGGFFAFSGSARGGKITGKGKIRTYKLDFEDVFFVNELKFNLFSVSQMCDKKNSVLFTETECLVLSLNFKLLDESQVLLRVPRQNNMYSFDLKNVVPSRDLTSSKDETSRILKRFIIEIENKLNHKVKVIRCDNGTEFKNRDMNEFCGLKGIKREFSVVRTPQQNGVVKRKNMTLIEAARTMLPDSLLPTVFWAEVVNTACYVLNKVLVTKPHNKTPYELIMARPPSISFMRPFGCPVTILNTIDPLGKFDGKAEEGFLVGYSVNSKAFRVQVYVDDIIFGSTKKSLCTDFKQIMHKRFQMSSMGELTFFLVSTPIETNKALTKDEDGEDVDIHLYRSMIGSLMYLTSSRPDIMFSVCACSRFQVQPKVSHLNAVKRIFRYLKGRPKLGLWYPKDSPFILESFSDSDYAGASLDRKSTTGGCQFLGSRLISWQCKKQTVVANSTTEAEYIAASHCCGQVLWIQN
ncbi:ribonuclease H-like domain-containing protein [Tanacetum coccineum]